MNLKGQIKSIWHTSFFTFMHWRRKWQPTPVFLRGESQGRGSPVGCRLWSRTELDRTEATQQQQQNMKIPVAPSSHHNMWLASLYHLDCPGRHGLHFMLSKLFIGLLVILIDCTLNYTFQSKPFHSIVHPLSFVCRSCLYSMKVKVAQSHLTL